MIRIETAEFIHEYFHRKNSSLTVRFILYNATRAQIKCNTFPAVLLCTYSVFDKFEITGLI